LNIPLHGRLEIVKKIYEISNDNEISNNNHYAVGYTNIFKRNKEDEIYNHTLPWRSKEYSQEVFKLAYLICIKLTDS